MTSVTQLEWEKEWAVGCEEKGNGARLCACLADVLYRVPGAARETFLMPPSRVLYVYHS